MLQNHSITVTERTCKICNEVGRRTGTTPFHFGFLSLLATRILIVGDKKQTAGEARWGDQQGNSHPPLPHRCCLASRVPPAVLPRFHHLQYRASIDSGVVIMPLNIRGWWLGLLLQDIVIAWQMLPTTQDWLTHHHVWSVENGWLTLPVFHEYPVTSFGNSILHQCLQSKMLILFRK